MNVATNNLLNQAVSSIQNGNLTRAKSLLAQLLKSSSNKSEVFRLLGVVEALEGNTNLSFEYFQKAINHNHKNALAHSNLGNIYRQKEDFQKALECYQKALSINADFETYYNLGSLYHLVGELQLAVKNYENSIRLNPVYIDAILSLSSIYIQSKNYSSALALLDKAIQSNINHPSIWFNKGCVLNEIKKFDQAINSLTKAIYLRPNDAHIYSNLANAYFGINDIENANKYYLEALRLDPVSPLINSNFGLFLQKQKNYQDSERYLLRAIQSDENFVKAWVNLGVNYFEQRIFDKSKLALNRALSSSPHDPDAHLNLAHVHFHLLEFENAWDEYEWRWQSSIHVSPKLDINIPQWNGEAGKKVLIWSEQGIGEQILYSTLFLDLIKLNLLATILVDKRLMPIFSRTYPEIKFLDNSNYTPQDDYDFQIAIGSLGKVLRRSLRAFDYHPSSRNLVADNNLVQTSQKLLEERVAPNQIICGLSWISTNLSLGADKSISLESLKPILLKKNLSFIDVQYLNSHEEREMARKNLDVNVIKIDEIDSFLDLESVFALIQNCDFVITVSNSVAHMAAALGKPTYILLPFGAGKFWYWVRNNGRCLWYQNVMCFEQTVHDDWSTPILQLKNEIERIWK